MDPSIKLQYGTEIRRIRVFLGSFDLAQLRNHVAVKFPEVTGEPVIKYIDDESDLITIKNNAELAEAVRVLREHSSDGKRSLKFYIYDGETAATAEVNEEPASLPQQVTLERSVVQEEISTSEAEVQADFSQTDESILDNFERIADIIAESVVNVVETVNNTDWSSSVKEGADIVSESVSKVVEKAQSEDWKEKVKQSAAVVQEEAAKLLEKVQSEEWQIKMKDGAVKTGNIIMQYGNEGSQYVKKGYSLARDEVQKMNDDQWRDFIKGKISSIQTDVNEYLTVVSAELSKLHGLLEHRPSMDMEAAPAPAVVEEEPKEEEWYITQEVEDVNSVGSSVEEQEEETESAQPFSDEFKMIREFLPECTPEVIFALLTKHQGDIQATINELMDTM